MTTLERPLSRLWFAIPLAAVYLTTFLVLDLLPRTVAPGALATGLTVDLVVLVPALYYYTMIRGRGWPAITLAPLFLVSFGVASVVIPGEHQTLLSVIGYAIPAVEVGVLGYAGYHGWRVVRANARTGSERGDFYDRMRETLRGAFDAPAFTGALAYELSLLHYAFSLPRRAPEHGFTQHRRSGYGAILAALLMAAGVELFGVHLLLRSWSEVAVWIHVGLSLYGIIWLVGDYRAIRSRPHVIGHGGLRVRCGLRWDVDLPWDRVASIRRTRVPPTDDGYLNAVPLGTPRYLVELSEPVRATGPYGTTREVRSVGILVDDAERFEDRLAEAGVRVET